MSLNPISDVKGYGEQDFPLSERAPGNAHQPWTVGHCTMPLSTQLEPSKVFKSFLLNLDPNLKISSQFDKKLQEYCEKNDSLEYLSKMPYLLAKSLLRV